VEAAAFMTFSMLASEYLLFYLLYLDIIIMICLCHDTHALNHYAVQWLLLIVHVAITGEVRSRVFRASESRLGPTIHTRATSLHPHNGR